MKLEDVQPKRDNADKIKYIEDNNIPADEVIRAEEFNALLEAVKALSGREQLKFKSETLLVAKENIKDTRVELEMTEIPIQGSLHVYVRGVHLDGNAYVVNSNHLTIYNNRMEYTVIEGDLITLTYNNY